MLIFTGTEFKCFAGNLAKRGPCTSVDRNRMINGGILDIQGHFWPFFWSKMAKLMVLNCLIEL